MPALRGRAVIQVRFVVSGDPVPQPRHRAGKNQKTGKIWMYMPKSDPSIAAKAEGAYRAKEALPEVWPMDAAMSMDLKFVFSSPKKSGAFHVSKPDADNCVKLCLDFCTGIVYNDDCQVCRLTASKRYVTVGEKPHTQVFVTVLGGEDAD